MNRKGEVAGSGLLFFVFFLMMIVVGAGISGGVWMFYGQGYDFRETESIVLFEQVVDCFVEEDYNFFEEGFDIYETCRLEKMVLSENHLVLVRRVSDGTEYFIGVRDFETQCFLDAREKNINLPLCVNSSIMNNGETYEIVVGSNQDSRKVATWTEKDNSDR